MAELYSASAWWDKFFKGGKSDFLTGSGTRLRVACMGVKVCPRDPEWEWHLDRGRDLIPRILRGEPLERSHVELVFPERWMNIHERRWLLDCLQNHPEVKSADILMQDPLIAGSVPDGCLVLADPKSGSTGLSNDDLGTIWSAKKAEASS